MRKEGFHICEYGIIKNANDYEGTIKSSLEELYIPEKSFNNLYNFILENQDASSNAEIPFLIFSKGRKRQIKVKNYVGVIETNDGMHLEILPKIHLNRSEEDVNATKKIFLDMLRHLKNSPFVNVSNAHLKTQNNFPILEVFIQSYVTEAEKLINHGVKSNYISVIENVNCIKGKLLTSDNIKTNRFNKVKFVCEFSEYSNNIPLNKLIKATLLKLLKITRNNVTSFKIGQVLNHLQNVDSSDNFRKDLTLCNVNNKLLYKYSTLLKWSEIFLLNKSFTNFKGESINMAILFPMERVFEDFITHLFSKYSDGLKVKAQDKSYFLIEKHQSQGKFRLKPDILVETDVSDKLIIDTKWKLIDEQKRTGNYNISQADMYQLYAYGKKYTVDHTEPRLVLLYPSNPNFTSPLAEFIYEGELRLDVIPFDLSGRYEEQISQILSILN